MPQTLQRTLLYDWHVKHGANMAPFGEYEMPLWYPAGAREEHLSVITRAGLFDTSHMAVITAAGPGTRDLLQLCFSKDLHSCVGKEKAPLTPGKCIYGVFLNRMGEVLDDAILYQFAADRYMIVVNSGQGRKITDHLEAHKDGRRADLTDLSGQIGKLDLQGPLSARILKKLIIKPDRVFANMHYFSFKGCFDETPESVNQVRLLDQTPLLLSRTGYTGEFGFEIFVRPECFKKTWELIIDSGKDMGLIPCGLAARDSLRTGAMLPLSHQDIGPWAFLNHPWPFALPYDGKFGFSKTFIGSEALEKQSNHAAHTYAFAGFDLRKVTVGNDTAVIDQNGQSLGQVLTCVTDMAIGRHENRIFCISSPDKPLGFKPGGLSCGFVKVIKPLDIGRIVRIKDKRREIPVMIADHIRPDCSARNAIQIMLS
ncbi:MAG: aminomethyl transferase family protein [Pseudomonadota bacterium]